MISSTLFSRMAGYQTQRITGLSSGMDIDSLVTNMLSRDQAKVDKYTQQKIKAEWKAEAYRSVNNTLRTFRQDFMSVLNPSKNIMSAAAFQQYAVEMLSDSKAVSITGGTNANTGSYTISDVTLATAAKVESSGEMVSGNATLSASTKLENISGLNFDDEGNIAFKINGEEFKFSKDTTLSKMMSTVNASDAGVKMQYSQLTDKFSITSNTTGANGGFVLEDVGAGNAFGAFKLGTGVIGVTAAHVGGSKVTSGSGGLDAAALSGAGTLDVNAKLGELAGENSPLKNKLQFVDGKVSFSINGEEFEFTEEDTLADVMKKVNESDAGVKMSYSKTEDKITIEGTGDTKEVTIENGAGNMFGDGSALAIGDGTHTEGASGGIGSTISLGDLAVSGAFANQLQFGADDKLSFSINGKDFTFTKDNTIADIMKAVNESEAGVTMAYDKGADRFTLTSTAKGADAKIEIVNVEGNLFGDGGALGIGQGVVATGASGADETIGKDATAKINGIDVTRSSNTFTIDGITYNLKAATKAGEEIGFTVSYDQDKVVDLVKEFVDGYNKMIESLDALYNETTYRAYDPLTDDQRSQLTEKQQEEWDKLAKSGTLKNDAYLGNLIQTLRSAFYTPVEGIGKSLSDIGLATGTWTDKGKIVLDESKLRAALEKNPDEVAALFNQSSKAEDSKTKFNQSGVISRISDIFTNHTKSTTDNAIVFAENAAKSAQNQIDNAMRILELNETKYYKQFTAMETALSKMNSQSSWIAQQLGSA